MAQAAQTDPWVEAAKNFKPDAQGGTASNEDWKIWQQNDQPQGNAVQREFDTLTTRTPEQDANTPAMLRPLAHFGAGAIQGAGQPFVHPIKTIEGIGHTIAHPIDTAQSVWASAKEDPAKAVGNIVGGAVTGMGGEAAGGGILSRFAPYRSPLVPAAEANAERLAQAVLPPEGVTPNLVKSISREAPHVREYAMRTSNPLKTVPEGMKAAEGVAQEGLAHYRQNFLEPNAGERITLENGVSKELGNTATLGDVEKRISDINDLVRGATRTAKSSGAEMTALERQGLENEAGALRQKLYQGLSEKTGVAPEEIQAMREGYGGQFSLKNALESGHMQRLTRTGLSSQGAGTGIYPSKAGIIDKVMTTLRGGPEAIANRQFSSRIAKFDPEAALRPMPKPNQ